MTLCNTPTVNYGSGRALLDHYDSNSDGTIDMPEMMQASTDYNSGKITKDELDFVERTWKQGEGGISKMCPHATQDIPWLLIGAAIILFWLLTRG